MAADLGLIGLSFHKAGWIVNAGEEKGVHVTPWVVAEETKNLYCSLVGFLKSGGEGFMKVEG